MWAILTLKVVIVPKTVLRNIVGVEKQELNVHLFADAAIV